jgi:hypothetical protein
MCIQNSQSRKAQNKNLLLLSIGKVTTAKGGFLYILLKTCDRHHKYFFFFSAVLEIELRALCMLGNHSAIELYPQPQYILLIAQMGSHYEYTALSEKMSYILFIYLQRQRQCGAVAKKTASRVRMLSFHPTWTSYSVPQFSPLHNEINKGTHFTRLLPG